MALPAPKLADAASRWPPIILVICVLLAFGRLLGAGFTWFDDHATIVSNAHLGPDGELLHFWAHAADDIYAPLTYTAWAVLARATWVQTPDETGAHVDPHVFHGANVALHLAAALLVYALLLELFRKPWAALAGALLFALHPLQVEAVGWASGTKDVMAGALELAALLCYARYARADNARWLVAATVAFLLAAFSKPSAVTTPLLAAIIDRCFIGRPWRKILPALVGWLLLTAPIIVVNRSVQVAVHGAETPLWFRPFVVGDALAFYLYKLVVPIGLAIQYPLRAGELAHHQFAYAGWLIPGALGVVAWRSKQRWLKAAALIFAAAPLTVLGFVAFDWQWYSIVADHYVYVALLGPALAVAGALAAAPRLGRAAIPLLVLLGCVTIRQAGFWQDNTALARHAIAVNPKSFVGYALLGTGAAGSDPAAAIGAYEAALAIEPRYLAVMGAVKPLLQARGREDELLEIARKFVEANDALPPASRVDASGSLRFLAAGYERRGDTARAAFYSDRLRRAPVGK